MSQFIQLSQGNLQFFSVYTLEAYIVVLVIAIVGATWVDIRKHRIPNWLVAAGLVIGVAFHASSPFGHGINFTVAGFAVGFMGLLPLYILGTMGAGDVKLMGMVGAYLGPTSALSALLATLIAGGVLALLAAIYKRALPQLVENLHTMLIQWGIRRMGGTGAEAIPAPPSVGKLPYALAIAAGTTVQIFMLRP